MYKGFVTVYSVPSRTFLIINIYSTDSKQLFRYGVHKGRVSFHAPYYQKADCGDSEDSGRQAGMVHVVFVNTVTKLHLDQRAGSFISR